MQKQGIFAFVVIFFLTGCFYQTEIPQAQEIPPTETTSPEIGQPEETVLPSEQLTEKTDEAAKEQPPEEILEQPACEKDVCFGNILQKCLFEKVQYNITCPELCKKDACVEKELFEEEFIFQDISLGQPIGFKKQVLTEYDLKALEPTKITTRQGLTEVHYLMRLGGDDDTVESGTLLYAKKGNTAGDYLVFRQGDDLFEYVLDFSRGFESAINEKNQLDDLVGTKLLFFGLPYQLVKAETDAAKKAISLTFLRGTEVALLGEGEMQDVFMGQKKYEIEIMMVDRERNKVRLSINGKVSPDLVIGDIFRVDSTFAISIKDIFSITEKGKEEMAVEFFTGAEQVEFIDTDATNNLFERNVRVNGAQLERGKSMIRATARSNVMRIELIKYRAQAKGKENDVFIAAHSSLRNESAEPASLITKEWDIIYNELAQEKNELIEIRHKNARTYELSFVNTNGESYTVPLTDATNNLKFGDDDNDLVFIESGTGNIDRDDFFVLTDANNEKGITRVFQLMSLDRENKKVTIKDLAGNMKDYSFIVGSDGIGIGSFSTDGKNHQFLVPANGSAVSVDLNGNGAINNDKVDIVASGLVIDLGSTMDISEKASIDIVMKTPANRLKNAQSDEEIRFTVTKGNEINILLSDQQALHLETLGDMLKGMTSYGAVYELTGSSRKDMKITYPQQQRLATATLRIEK